VATDTKPGSSLRVRLRVGLGGNGETVVYFLLLSGVWEPNRVVWSTVVRGRFVASVVIHTACKITAWLAGGRREYEVWRTCRVWLCGVQL
jgi:hypothetical protein